MSSGRIPSRAKLRKIVKHVSCYIEHTRPLLEKYPAGRAPRGESHARDVAMEGLESVLSSGDAAAPYGWPEPTCRALEELTRIVDDLRSWHVPLVAWDLAALDRPLPDDQFNAPDEALVLSRLVELVAILKRALADKPSHAPASGSEGEHARDTPLLTQATDQPDTRSKSEGKSNDPASELRRLRKPIQAALVEYMRNRDSATFDEIKFHVHGDEQVSDVAVRQNVFRTNESLGERKVPMRFSASSGFVYKETWSE
jgi:hypothetical protein